jgi:predicted nucleic acid-binding protein
LNPAEPIVCNTTILSNFASVGQWELLQRVFQGREVYTTAFVLDEVSAGVEAGYAYLAPVEKTLIEKGAWITILPLTLTELELYCDLRLHLGPGEASCLSIALNRGYVLATDDLAARKRAKKLGVSLIGTVGALVLCRRGILTLDEANRILKGMIEAGYRSPVSRLDELWEGKAV